MQDDKITVVGCQGNMGKRISAILNWEGIEHTGIDIGFHEDSWKHVGRKCIIETPTETHVDCIYKAFNNGAREILCEKPITKDPDEIRELMKLNARIYMVCNWKFALLPLKLLEPNQHVCFYNCYNTGPDSNQWDMIQLEYLCKHLEVHRVSPVFTCCVDGFSVTREMIDKSYMYMIDDFIKGGKGLWNLTNAMEATLKCM